jgi:TM2 domain-containing membrane protein YozV
MNEQDPGQPQYQPQDPGQPQYQQQVPGYQQPPYNQQYGQQPGYQPPLPKRGWGSEEKDKWVAAVLAFTLGVFGIHKFYLGYKNEGMIMLLVSLIGSLCLGLGPLVMLVIAYIEAVRYVILTQQDFQTTYVIGSKPWL